MADMSKWDMFKKRIGPSSSRDSRVTWGGIFGTQSSRKAQQKRLAEKPPSQKSAKLSPSDIRMTSAKSKTVSEVRPTARKKMSPLSSVPSKAASPSSRPAGRKTSTSASPDPGLSAAKMLGGSGGLSEDNAVMKRLRQRAMERSVAKAKKK